MNRVRSQRTTCLLLGLIVGLAGCATGGSGGSGDDRRDIDVLTLEELSQEPGGDLFTVIERLRPRWLRARSDRTFASTTTVSLVLDGVRRYDGLDVLRTIRTVTVAEARFMNARDATTLYGPDMAGGAIIVTTKR